MGNIASRPDDMSNMYLKDQSRFSIKSVVVTNGRKKVLLSLNPNGYPATRLLAKREPGDDTPISYIQDFDSANPTFLLRLDLEDQLEFQFLFVSRQSSVSQATTTQSSSTLSSTDTSINGLTFAYAGSTKDLDTLITREFHADPNLHKNSNVQFIGDFSTNGSPSIEYEWSWKWKPPRVGEDKGGGWRNYCSFLEYDSRAHRLNTLASFIFWVQNSPPTARTPTIAPYVDLTVPQPIRNRMPSSQSYNSAVSDSEGPEIITPIPNSSLPTPAELMPSLPTMELLPTPGATQPVVDVSCQRPGEDMSNVEDGPVFRATMKSLEQKTGSMRTQIKKVLKKAEAAQQAQVECNEAMNAFLAALQDASGSNASAFKPALDHYFTKIAKRILQYETENGNLLRKQIIDPLSKLYNLDIKQADAKRKDFEDESRDYYAYVSRYLGQRQDSLKEKKRAESDSKYQTKKKNFELARFDYSSFMQDLHGGRKEQELLSQLTKYADGQAKSFLATAEKVESLQPQLDALVKEVREADKEYRIQRTEREEKRRNLEMNANPTAPSESEVISQVVSNPSISAQSNGYGGYTSDTDLSRADSTSSQFNSTGRTTLSPSNSVLHGSSNTQNLSASSAPAIVTSNANKFKGIRDLEEREPSSSGIDRPGAVQNRKEGLLWALSKPGSHIDPKGINKQAWHKFWIVLDQGKLSEYANWKERLDLHREPIDLRMASVRTARDAERRFCFEVITPQYKRIYQATTEDEMLNWINAINNALQNAFEGRNTAPVTPVSRHESTKSEYGAILTGKSSLSSGGQVTGSRPDSHGVSRSSTVGSRPSYLRASTSTFEENPTKLTDLLRAHDQGNQFCADCGSNSRVEWTSINLGIILCIECGGIHRSLGTHVSKVRSLTLDTNSFTDDIVELLLQIGNRISNMIWEAKLEQRLKPEPWANRETRLKFITAKYVERAYVDAGSMQSHFTATDDNLLTSIKKNDIRGVLFAIAQRANVNTHDRSRNTHAVFLALAAADPAYPSSAASSPLPSPTPSARGAEAAIKPFPVAELLIQNGAEIPAQMPAIPLSAAAQLYIEQRTARSGNIAMGDTLGPLPNVAGGKAGGDGKLQKRGSAGARFAGKVGSLAER